MNNGQMSMTSVQTVTQLVTQDSTAPVTTTLDGMQQNGGGFAGLLSGIQLVAKGKDLPDSGQKEQLLIKVGKQPLLLDAGAEGPSVGLLAQLSVSPHILATSEPVAPKQEESKKADVSKDAAPLSSEPTDVTAQMAMAAYLQTGRIPEVNIPAPLPVDSLQNVATATVQPAVITTPAVKNQTEQTAAEPTQTSTQKPTVTPAKEPVSGPASETNQHNKPETVRTTTVDWQPLTIVATPTAAPTAVKPETSDRTSNVNIPAPLPVDSLQNVATATEQSAVITAPAVKNQTEQTATEPTQTSTQKPTVTLAKEPVSGPAAGPNQQNQPETVRTTTVDWQPLTIVATPTAAPTAVKLETSDRMSNVNAPAPLPVDRLQNVATATVQPAVITAPAVKIQSEQAAAELTKAQSLKPPVTLAKELGAYPAARPNQNNQPETVRTTSLDMQPVTIVATAPTAVKPEPSDRMPGVNKPTPLPVDRLQDVAAATEQPAVVTAPADKSQVTQTTAEPVQTISAEASISLSLKTATVPVPDEQIVPQRAKTADLPVIPAELPAANLTALALVSTPELEVEIQLSQPQPITAQVTAAPAIAGGRSAAVVQGIPGARQRLNPEQQIEKVRTGNEQSLVKETASSLQVAATVGESTLGSDTSSGSDSNQGQPDSASDNQMLAQNMRGQLSTEHQKVAAITTKSVPTESVRQDLPEQVMQQVKERLVQHDVKPGSQQITLTLSPDSLGELKMSLNLQGQKLSVEIVTENRTVRDAIILHTDALKESLARQNITMESFDVTTGGKGSGNQGQNQNAWRELAKQQQQQQSWTSPRGYNTAQAGLPSAQTAYQRQQGQSMLDIHY